MATRPAQRQGTTLNTDLEIYQARLRQAEERIAADRRADRAPTTLDLHRRDLNLRLIAAIEAEELVKTEDLTSSAL